MSRIVTQILSGSISDDEDEELEEGEWSPRSLIRQTRSLLCIEEGRLVASFWSGNLSGENFGGDCFMK